jgi:ketosteroid isomerase-like protein
VGRGYDALNRALNREDVDAWLEGFHPDVEVHDLPTIPGAPVYRGHDALRKWVEMMREVWEEGSYYEPQRFMPRGDFVVVAVRGHARGRGSRVPIELDFFQVFEMREGKVQRCWAYFEEAEALDAVALSE